MSDELSEAQKKRASRAAKKAERKTKFLAGLKELVDAVAVTDAVDLEERARHLQELWDPSRDGLIEEVDGMLWGLVQRANAGDEVASAAAQELAKAYFPSDYHEAIGCWIVGAMMALSKKLEEEHRPGYAERTPLGQAITEALIEAGAPRDRALTKAAFLAALPRAPGERVSVHRVRGVNDSWLAPFMTDAEWMKLRSITRGEIATVRVPATGRMTRAEIDRISAGASVLKGFDVARFRGWLAADNGVLDNSAKAARDLIETGRYPLDFVRRSLRMDRTQVELACREVAKVWPMTTRLRAIARFIASGKSWTRAA